VWRTLIGRAEALEVCGQLREATDVAAGDDGGAAGDDGPGLFLAESGGDLGLVEVVGAGAAATEMGIGQLDDFAPGMARSSARGSARTPWALAR
jgi:hypothetical protein